MVGRRDVGSVEARGPMANRVQAFNADHHGSFWSLMCPCDRAFSSASTHCLVRLVALACIRPSNGHVRRGEPGTLRRGTCHLRIYQRCMRVPPLSNADTTGPDSKAGGGAPTHPGTAQGSANADGASLSLQHLECNHEPGCPRKKSRSNEDTGSPQYDFAHDASAQ